MNLSLFQRWPAIASLMTTITTLSLSGCSATADHRVDVTSHSPAIVTAKEPRLPLVCSAIWHPENNQHDQDDEPQYWLQVMDCAMRLSPSEAQLHAERLSGRRWQDIFKRNILLERSGAAPAERQRALTGLEASVSGAPTSVALLMHLWREQQTSQLAWVDLRSRYELLRQQSEADLENARQQQLSLSHELADTRRKLTSLTDIERRLSVRRSADLPDPVHSSDKSEPSGSDKNQAPVSSSGARERHHADQGSSHAE